MEAIHNQAPAEKVETGLQEIRHHVQDVIARFADQHPGVRKSIAITLVLILVGLAWAERELGIDVVNSTQVTATAKSAQTILATIFAFAGLAFLFVQGVLSGTRGRIVDFLMVMGVVLGIYRSVTVYQSMVSAAVLQNTAQVALMSRINGIQKSIAEHEATLTKKKSMNPNTGFEEAAKARTELARQKQTAARKQADSVFKDSRADGTQALAQVSKDLDAVEKIQEKRTAEEKSAQGEVDKEQFIVDGLRVQKSELEQQVKPTAEGIFGDVGFKMKTFLVALVLVGVEWLAATLLGTIVAAFGFASRSVALHRAAMDKKPVQPVMPEMPTPPDMAGAIKDAAGVATGVVTATTIALNPATAQEPPPPIPQVVAVTHQQVEVTNWRFQVEVPPTSTYATPATSTRVEVKNAERVEVVAQNGEISAAQVEVGTQNTEIEATQVEVLGELPSQVEVFPDIGRGLEVGQVEVVVDEYGALAGIRSPYAELVEAIRAHEVQPNVPSIKSFMRCGQATAEEYLERLKREGWISGGGKGKAYKVVEVKA